jgi:hypothetical protein
MAKRRRVRLAPGEPWTEASIAKALAYGLLQGRSVLVVPNCHWTGSECDLLVLEPGLRIIDVEIKISRADLRADLKKDKWWKSRPWSRRHRARERREWPEKVWKHYYCMPSAIWTDELYADIPATSGVILLCEPGKAHGGPWIRIVRRAKPNREAKPISAADAIDLSRLTSLRLWSALSTTQGETTCQRAY